MKAIWMFAFLQLTKHVPKCMILNAHQQHMIISVASTETFAMFSIVQFLTFF
jgi:hypothetical protein